MLVQKAASDGALAVVDGARRAAGPRLLLVALNVTC